MSNIQQDDALEKIAKRSQYIADMRQKERAAATCGARLRA